MDIEKHIEEIKKEGLTLITDQFSKEECNYYVDKFETILKKFTESGKYADPKCTLIRNPFRHDIDLVNLIYQDKVNRILNNLLDENHVLVNTTVINRKLDKNTKVDSGDMMGDQWHSDVPDYSNNKKLPRGIFYHSLIMFSDHTTQNAATFYVPQSHLLNDRPDKSLNYEGVSKRLEGKAGTIAVFDSTIWHRGGDPTYMDRWGLFSMFSPWYIKPYFKFPEMLGEKFGKETSTELRRLLHYNSNPPLNEDESVYTLKKE